MPMAIQSSDSSLHPAKKLLQQTNVNIEEEKRESSHDQSSIEFGTEGSKRVLESKSIRPKALVISVAIPTSALALSRIGPLSFSHPLRFRSGSPFSQSKSNKSAEDVS